MVAYAKPNKPKKKPVGRPPTTDIYPGKYFGHLRIVRKVRLKTGPHYDCICEAPKKDGTKCMKPYRVRPAYIVRRDHPTTNCGCQTYINANPYAREKGIWYMLFQRCENPDHVSYKYYGALGVKVHERYHKNNPSGFFNFIADLGGAPTKQHTLDRIDPRKNYEPGNLRWATKAQQASNKRSHWEGKPL